MITTEKTCFKCSKSKPLSEFYKHKMMADGHLGKCKECTKEDVKMNRASKSEYYKSFDRARGNLPHRVAAREEYRKTLNYSISHAKALRSYRIRHPERMAAHQAVNSAVRNGILNPLPCMICGNKAEAHHHDYSLPLYVVWLCKEHHIQAHNLHRDLERDAA